MNQEMIGKFIAECRKMKKLTQEELALKLGISNRAVSKWERGLNLPDASLMLELSNIFNITINELLCGEMIEKEEYLNKAEEKLVELKEKEELANKKLLNIEIVIGVLSTIVFVTLILIASIIEMDKIGIILLVTLAIFVFAIGLITAMKLEREVGYYECQKCHYKYVPTNKQMWLSMQVLRNRYIKCPKCGKKSWNKKVLSK